MKNAVNGKYRKKHSQRRIPKSTIGRIMTCIIILGMRSSITSSNITTIKTIDEMNRFMEIGYIYIYILILEQMDAFAK